MMMSDDRNFRYFYYEKVGFRGVEEKKSLDILLTEKPNDLLSKLSAFAHRFPIPGMYRKLIWKLLLDVMTVNELQSNSVDNSFVCREQLHHCYDLRRALEIMLYTDNSTGHSKLMVLMYFLEFAELNINIDKQFQTNEVKDLLMISDVFAKEFIDDKNKAEDNIDDIYWLFRNLISTVRNNFYALIDTYEKFINCLAQEDRSLHCHLVKIGIIKVQTNQIPTNSCVKLNYKKYNTEEYRPIITWFVRFYAGIIDHHCLIRIFDKVIGALIYGNRPFAVLGSLGKAVLSQLRTELLNMNTCEDITKRLLTPLTLEQSEEVVIKALTP
ncbi:TBC1 domain family member 7-like [Oppia nitens]|uniref:TBC1 domain family member 7-like n=1 Tax=Oppia nitens TaxID=1686743 RepID=UPI0023DC2F3F|nr:TBC1 domain family member 7-like [Oppia nitens]